MIFTTRAEIDSYIEARAAFEARARAVAIEYAAITYSSYEVEHASFDGEEDGFLWFNWYHHQDTDGLRVRYMWEENWQETLVAELAEKERLRKQDIEDRKQADKISRERSRRALYEALKKEYEG